jgi:Mg2+/Co2+ transporter CorB
MVEVDLLIQIIILVICLIGSAFFSAVETALTAMSKLRVKKLIGING